MSPEQRQENIIAEFSQVQGWEARYRKIIEIGKNLKPLEDALKKEDLKVKGCQSQVWIHASLNEHKRIVFQGDGDAIIVRGLVALVLRVYSDSTSSEILQSEPRFVSAIGLESHLSPSRTNGLFAMIKQIKYYAAAFQALGA